MRKSQEKTCNFGNMEHNRRSMYENVVVRENCLKTKRSKRQKIF